MLEKLLNENKALTNENNELKKTLYIIEKAICDFRLSQLNAPQQVVTPVVANVPQVHTEDFNLAEWKPIEEPHCNCGCHNENPSAEIEEVFAEREEINEDENTSLAEDINLNKIAEERSNIGSTFTVTKPKRQYKQRGGSVFRDFKTLTLDNENNYEGNTIVFSTKGD